MSSNTLCGRSSRKWACKPGTRRRSRTTASTPSRVNNTAVFGGMCIIQAKRYRGAVGVEAIRALAGVMEDKHATKGILITTSWVTKDGHAFATPPRPHRIMECEHVKYLCKEHLGLDVLISLPSHPRADVHALS